MNFRLLPHSAAIVLLTLSTSQGALVITEVMAASAGSGAYNGDWFELTNTGDTAINLENYYWDDNGASGNDGSVFPAVTIAGGESIAIVAESAGNLVDWLAAWGGGFTAISEDVFTGPDSFSGLGSDGDQIEIWDADPNAGPANLVASVTFGASTDGSSFEWDASGNYLGLSVSGVNEASTNATSGDIASPGIAVPEPGSALLAALGLLGFLRRSR